jgi:hypothetical protein
MYPQKPTSTKSRQTCIRWHGMGNGRQGDRLVNGMGAEEIFPLPADDCQAQRGFLRKHHHTGTRRSPAPLFVSRQCPDQSPVPAVAAKPSPRTADSGSAARTVEGRFACLSIHLSSYYVLHTVRTDVVAVDGRVPLPEGQLEGHKHKAKLTRNTRAFSTNGLRYSEPILAAAGGSSPLTFPSHAQSRSPAGPASLP